MWDPDQVINLGSAARPHVPWLRYAGMWGKPADGKLEGNGPEGPILKGSFYGRHLRAFYLTSLYKRRVILYAAMTAENSIPVSAVGNNSWWAQRKAEEDARIAASGASLIRIRSPAAAEKPAK